MRKADLKHWAMGVALVAFIVYAPYYYYRYTLEHGKRLRPVEEGILYRSGCLTADGFRDAIQKLKIKTVITFWDENPDPVLYNNRFSFQSTREKELCKSLGVDYKFIHVKLLADVQVGKEAPPAIDEFLKVMDDPRSHPVLIHCKAGLHRTGVMSAVYRMEYNGWSREEAMRELRSHGFGHFTANRTNDYINQFVLLYQPRAAASSQQQRTVPGATVSRQR